LNESPPLGFTLDVYTSLVFMYFQCYISPWNECYTWPYWKWKVIV